MKKLALITTFLFACSFCYAQSPNYHMDMKDGILMLDTSKTTSGYFTTQSHWEKVANANGKDWLAQYYAAYSKLILGIKGKEEEEAKDEIYSHALNYINQADVLSPNNSEIYALKGYIVFMKMAVYPTKRAMNMIPESNNLLEKAITLNAQNPRAYLLKAQNTFYTPEMFGGGKADAKVILIMASKKFDTYAAEGFAPNWGKKRCEELLKEY